MVDVRYQIWKFCCQLGWMLRRGTAIVYNIGGSASSSANILSDIETSLTIILFKISVTKNLQQF